MNEKDIREYSRTLLDAFNDLTGNSINPNLDDFLKIRERSIFELNSFQKNNQKTNEIIENVENVNDTEVVNVHSNQKTNVDENKSVNEIDDLKKHKELSSTPTSKVTSKVEKQKNTKTEDKPTLIQNKNQNIDNKESKDVVKNETSNSNVIADETDETDETDDETNDFDFVFGNDEDNFNMSERKTAFDILKGIEDPWN